MTRSLGLQPGAVIRLPSDDDLLAHAIGLASKVATGLTPVINATGVVLHTNLGRAPLPEAAARRRRPSRSDLLGPGGRPRDG